MASQNEDNCGSNLEIVLGVKTGNGHNVVSIKKVDKKPTAGVGPVRCDKRNERDPRPFPTRESYFLPLGQRKILPNPPCISIATSIAQSIVGATSPSGIVNQQQQPQSQPSQSQPQSQPSQSQPQLQPQSQPQQQQPQQKRMRRSASGVYTFKGVPLLFLGVPLEIPVLQELLYFEAAALAGTPEMDEKTRSMIARGEYSFFYKKKHVDRSSTQKIVIMKAQQFTIFSLLLGILRTICTALEDYGTPVDQVFSTIKDLVKD